MVYRLDNSKEICKTALNIQITKAYKVLVNLTKKFQLVGEG
jgi:hypothetical protein